MKHAARGLILLLLVAAIAGTTCWFTARYLNPINHVDTAGAHAWIHTQLGITPEQEKALEPIEKRYAAQRKHLEEVLWTANADLGRAIVEDQSESDRVKATVKRIQEAQGELQNATLEHIFEMRLVLAPRQYEKLLKSTAEALSTAERGK